MKLGLPIAGVVVALALLVVWSVRLWDAVRESRPVLAPTLIHLPSTGCPKGWIVIKDAFERSDGSKHDACQREGVNEVIVDRLDPGESVIIGFIEIPARHASDEVKT